MRFLAWLLILGLLFVPALPEPPLRSGAVVQDVTPTSAAILKIDARPRSRVLEVVRADGAGERVVVESARRRRHVLRVGGLEPDTAYRYWLHGGPRVETGSFTTFSTSDGKVVDFAVVGDSGGLPGWVWLQDKPIGYPIGAFDLLPTRHEVTAIGSALAAQPPQLWFHVGDIVYPRGEHRHYRAGFYRPFADLLRVSPCYAVLGNHDDDYTGSRPALANFVLPEDGTTGSERFWSFRHGPCRFLGLDLNQRVTEDHPALAFLRAELEAATEPWIFVFNHFPADSASRSRGNRDDLIENVLPLLREHGVDFWICGHDHVYQRFGDPGGLIQVCTGAGGKSLYEMSDHPDLRVGAPIYHHCRFRVDGAVATLEVRTLDGWLLERLVVDKQQLAGQGRLAVPAGGARERRLRALFD